MNVRSIVAFTLPFSQADWPQQHFRFHTVVFYERGRVARQTILAHQQLSRYRFAAAIYYLDVLTLHSMVQAWKKETEDERQPNGDRAVDVAGIISPAAAAASDDSL